MPQSQSRYYVYEAIEGKDSFVHSTQLADRVFPAKKAVETGTQEVLSIIFDAEQDFKKRLKQYSILDLLKLREDGSDGIDWRNYEPQSQTAFV